MADSTAERTDSATADRIVLAARAAPGAGLDPDGVIEAVSTRAYRRYLGRAHTGPVAVGDEWTEFVNCGCGTRADVVLRVVAVEGGSSVGPDTGFAFEPA